MTLNLWICNKKDLYFIFWSCPSPSLCGSRLGDHLLEGGRVGANNLASLLLVDKGEEGGHGADGLLLGDLGDGVDVNLGKVDTGELGVVGESGRLAGDSNQNVGGWARTHFSKMGEMTLQGPHHVA